MNIYTFFIHFLFGIESLNKLKEMKDDEQNLAKQNFRQNIQKLNGKFVQYSIKNFLKTT